MYWLVRAEDEKDGFRLEEDLAEVTLVTSLLEVALE